METVQTLKQKLAKTQQQAAELSKKESALRKEIEKIHNANKPKSIMERINDYSDILSILGADEKKDVIKIDKFDAAEHELVRNFIKKVRIPKAYNEGWLPKIGENRWYAWWHWVSSGFVFDGASCADTFAHTSSASRLCFETNKKTIDASKKFPDVEEAFITG